MEAERQQKLMESCEYLNVHKRDPREDGIISVFKLNTFHVIYGYLWSIFKQLQFFWLLLSGHPYIT